MKLRLIATIFFSMVTLVGASATTRVTGYLPPPCNSDWCPPPGPVDVYSPSEVDAMAKTVEQHAAERLRTTEQGLMAEISQLKKNVKDLSDANDALTKRLDDLNKKVERLAGPRAKAM